jgi:acid phosphatase family membrane protein YuiD
MSGLKYVVVVGAAWLLAHAIKAVVYRVRTGELTLKSILRSGGMPSAHAAVMVSILTLIGLEQGLSPLFGLALAITTVVVYDAVNVRRSVGEQAGVLLDLMRRHGGLIKPLKLVRGHNLVEALVGVLVGIFTAVGVYLLMF